MVQGATGTLLATVQVDCCQTGQGFVFATVTVEASGIRSVRFIGGPSSNPNSVFYDNITVTPEAVDSDNDGYPNDADACQQSDLHDTVVVGGCDSGSHNALHENGCTTADEITACAEDAMNHGNFVSCVSHVTQILKKDGYLTNKEAQAILSCAACAPLP